MKRVYYAHSIDLYGTEQERRDMITLASMGFTVVNPNQPEHDAGYKRDGMIYFNAILESCHVLAFRANPDGSINAGIGHEIEKMRADEKIVIELPSMVAFRYMTVPKTRAYLLETGYR